VSENQQGAVKAHGLRYPFENLPEADAPIEVSPGMFWARMSLPFALDHINVWLLEDGDGYAIIDTCVDMDISRKTWETLFDGFMGGKKVTKVIVTHMHPDHVGLAGWLVKRFDAPFYMSRTDYLMCRTMASDTGKKAPEEGVRFYRAAGFDDYALDRYRERFGGFGEAIHPLPQSYNRLQQGDVLRIGDTDWHIEVGSGHAPEHICLYSPTRKVLISGDQVIPRISSIVSLFPTEPQGNPLQDWIDSCARLKRDLPDDVLVCPSHNEPFYGLHARLQALIDGHEKALERVYEICEEPHKAVDGKIFSTLFKRKITREVFFMATGESLAHLMCLVHRGRLKMDFDENGVCYFQQAA
jgi:glyoxylase-like metal-dependent hydrolase (beta-lactamase superfamily II)